MAKSITKQIFVDGNYIIALILRAWKIQSIGIETSQSFMNIHRNILIHLKLTGAKTRMCIVQHSF